MLHWSGLKARVEEKSVKVATRSAVVEAMYDVSKNGKALATVLWEMLIKECIKEVPAWRASLLR